MTAIHHFWLGASPYSAVVVSGLFPAYAVDGLAPALSLGASGSLVEMPRPLEAMSASLNLTGGSLQVLLVGAQDLGAISPSLGISTGSLVSGLQGTTYGAEAMASSLGITGGTLVLGLISRTYETEGIAPVLGITSGTLA